jgi:hypothetical protein
MRCALIEAAKASYPITWMCDQLGVARSSFYAGRAAAATMTATAARRLWGFQKLAVCLACGFRLRVRSG